ncbi:breast carcinoma-amplified sequence 4 isoform X2 [Cervus elaphus]|uniref:breast carcinoma-amplified sequence 4 isoform X2 n=1 Tax=Cervus elaphus TaxID=9860 RepID=UPI001CC27957|nr:breast carcinoma-amplified sequence 4 isoform X2 [Cervus elaphus]
MLLLDADRPEPVRGGARELAVFLTPEPGAEAKEVEETIEGLLLRLEEFCSLADMAFVKMVRRHVSFLEAHVLQAERDHGALSQTLRKWLGSSGLPALGNGDQEPPSHTVLCPPMAQKHHRGGRTEVLAACCLQQKRWAPVAPTFELPALYRTEDYFPVDVGEVMPRASSCQRRL